MAHKKTARITPGGSSVFVAILAHEKSKKGCFLGAC